MPFLVSTEGPKIATGDVNGDGRRFYIGGAKHQQVHYLYNKRESYLRTQNRFA